MKCVFSYYCVLKEAQQGVTDSTAVSAGVAAGSSETHDAAVGQLIDFGSETPSPGPTDAMAKLCMFLYADELWCLAWHN